MARNRQVTLIKPELIDEGDIIEVQYPDDGGITVVKRGVVAYIQAHAGGRYFLTQQGATIACYSPGKPTDLKFSLIARIAPANEMLEMFEERLSI